VTLFDSPEDDEFDGDLGDDDDETPRILLKFEIEVNEKISKVNLGKDTLKESQKSLISEKIENVNRNEIENSENLMSKNSQAKIIPANNEQGGVELETKIDNLITVLESQRSMCQSSSRRDLISSENNNNK